MKRGRFLRLTSARLALAVRIVLIVVGGALAIRISLPLPAWVPPAIELAPSSPDKPKTPAAPIDIEQVCRRDLRQPLVDAPPPVATRAPETPISVRLVGTAIESERQFGIFALANNTSVLKEVGASIDGYEIVGVERGLARLRRGDRLVELRVPRYEHLLDGIAP